MIKVICSMYIIYVARALILTITRRLRGVKLQKKQSVSISQY